MKLKPVEELAREVGLNEIIDYCFSDELIEKHLKNFRKACYADLLSQLEIEAYLRTNGTGSPVVSAEFLKDKPEFKQDFEHPLYNLNPLKELLDDPAY